MASSTLPNADSALAAELRACDAVIEQQLDRTRQQVRLVELATVAAGWLVGVLALLLAAAIVDHWLLPLGAVGRWGLLLALVAGSGYYAWRRVLPLVLKRINPVYAAQAIEHAQPSLKNSLINFLLLRNDSRGVKEGIMQAVERQAASDIAQVPVDLAVDRSQAIRLGYVLVGILAIAAAYKILSPKDPFQTAARVLAPWASIARPSRVQITDVQPGNIEVYQGQTVTVSATVMGLRDGEIARVLYSTADGRVVDRAVPVKAPEGGGQLQCVLPAEEDSRHGLPGLQQNIRYRVVAGDATSESYELRVRPVPTIMVERVDYVFPTYMKRPPQTQERSGDVQAVEGARVTVHARANQPIQSAAIEFDPPLAGSGGSPAETLSMEIDGDRARATFSLEFKADRQSPKHVSYQLRFYNDRGERSEQPTLHRIDVLPDLPPEVQILAPTQPKVEVPLDGEQVVEVRAVDPDFGLMKVGLRGLRGEETVLERSLLETKDIGQTQGAYKFTFRPAKHGLQPGDEVHYWAWAEDGRQSPRGASEPNLARTPTYLFVITAPVKPAGDDPRRKPDPMDDAAPAPGDKPEAGDNRGEKKPGEKSEDKPGEKPGSEKPEEGAPNKPGEKQEDKPGERSGSAKSESNSGGEKNGKQKPEDKNGGKKQGEQGGNQESGGGKGGESGAQGGASGKGNEKGSEQGEAGGDASGGATGKQPGTKSGEKQPGEGSEGTGESTGRQPGEKSSQPGSKQTGSGGDPNDPNGTREAGGEGGEPTAGKPGEGSRGGQSTKPQHDGEAFERILERMKEQEKQNGKSPENAGDKPGDKNGDARQEGKGSAGKPGEGAQSENNAGNKQPGESGNAGQQGSSARKPDAGAAGDQTKGQGGAAGDPKPDQANDKNGKESGAGAGKQPDDKATGPQKPDSRQGAGGKQEGAPGEGGNPQNANRTDPGKKPGESGAEQGAKKDPGMGDNGSSGAGQNSKDKTGSGEGTEANRDRPKSEGSDSSAPKDGDTSAASGSKKQSDSKGGESGDQSGGGKKGAGQSAGQEGNDSAGSKSSADQGAGKSNERGSGETGPKGGQEQKTDDRTGSAGDEAGNGSSAKPGESGKQPGGAAGESGKPDEAKGTQAAQRGKQRGKGPVDGGGIPDDGPAGDAAPTKEGTTPDGEKANLDYAKKATDLALDYLKDQEHNPDPELLKRLGWTQEELQEFIRRWETMQKSADQPEQKRELDETLRSLGLRPPRSEKRAGGKVNDAVRDLRDTGGRTQPPSKYREQFDAFRKGKR
jgi:hypothetical protein